MRDIHDNKGADNAWYLQCHLREWDVYVASEVMTFDEPFFSWECFVVFSWKRMMHTCQGPAWPLCLWEHRMKVS